MEKMVAFCGLICTDCPTYIATQNDNDEERKNIAEQWSSDQLQLKPEDINCDGCLTVGKRLIKFCSMCEVRACGFEKKVENCAHCDDYPCEKLDKLLEHIQAPEAKTTLEEIKKNL